MALDVPFAAKICISDKLCFILSPFLHTHLLYQTQIEHLHIMGDHCCHVGIRVKVIAWEVGAVGAKLNALRADALEYLARLNPQGRDSTSCPASLAQGFIECKAELLGKRFHLFSGRFIIICQIKDAVEAIQAAWCS